MIHKTTKLLSLCIAGLIALSSLSGCNTVEESAATTTAAEQKEPPTPARFYETIHSDRDVSIVTRVRYSNGADESDWTYQTVRNGQKVYYSLKRADKDKYDIERYFDFANALQYYQPGNNQQWKTDSSYGSWEEFADPDQLYLYVSFYKSLTAIFETDRYAITDGQYRITEAGAAQILTEHPISDQYGDNPRFISTFEWDNGNMVHVERIESEDGIVWTECRVTITKKEMTVKLPQIEQ